MIELQDLNGCTIVDIEIEEEDYWLGEKGEKVVTGIRLVYLNQRRERKTLDLDSKAHGHVSQAFIVVNDNETF